MTTDDRPADAGWIDLAETVAGAGVTRGTGRRRRAADAEEDAEVAFRLGELTEASWWDRARGRRPAWRVLHGVPLGDGPDADLVDHMLIGPPGVVTVTTEPHRTGRVDLNGDDLVVDGGSTDRVPEARREAARASSLLGAALARERPEPAGRVEVRPVVVVVGGRLTITKWPDDVTVAKVEQVAHLLRSLRPVLGPAEVDAVFELARRSTTWAPPAAG